MNDNKKYISFRPIVDGSITRLIGGVGGMEVERSRLAGELRKRVAGELLSVEIEFLKIQATFDNLSKMLMNLRLYASGISYDLNAPDFQQVSLSDALADYVHLQHRKHLEIQFHLSLKPKDNWEIICSTVALALYRITQEAVNNVLQHASAKNLRIQLSRTAGMVELVIKDDGKGFDPIQNNAHGIGLHIIHGWIERVKGSIQLLSKPKKGTEIRLVCPIRLEQA